MSRIRSKKDGLDEKYSKLVENTDLFIYDPIQKRSTQILKVGGILPGKRGHF